MTRTKQAALLLLTAAALALLFFLFPLTGDDWYREGLGSTLHSLPALLREVAFRWRTTNSRILGNVLAYWAGSRPAVRIVLKTVLTLLLFCSAARTAGLRTNSGFLLLAAGLFALPREMFCQIYPWSAGFFNYVPPVALSLLCLCLVHELFEGEPLPRSFARCTALLLLGFCGQLFMEHNTLYALCAAAALLLWHRIAHRRFSACLWCYLAGTLLGAGLLFASPSYRAAAQGGGAYHLGLLASAAENLPELISRLTPPVLCAVAALATLPHLRKKPALAVLLALSTIYLALRRWLPGQGYAALVWWTLLGAAVFSLPQGVCRRRAVFFFFSALAAALPLLFVSPIGPRCFFASYVFLLLAAAQLLLAAKRRPAAEHIAAGAMAVAVFSVCLLIYLPQHRTALLRAQAIEAGMQQRLTQITLPQFPHAQFLWDADTQKLCRTYYYETPGDIAFVFVPEEEWTP